MDWKASVPRSALLSLKLGWPSLFHPTVFTESKIISCSVAWCYGTLVSCGNLWKLFSKLQSYSYIPRTGHSGLAAHNLSTSDPPHAVLQLLHDKLLIKHAGVDVALQRCSARFSIGATVILTEVLVTFLGHSRPSNNRLIKSLPFPFTFAIIIHQSSYDSTISVDNATYLFPPSTSHFHNMFRPYMAIIRCYFTKNSFAVWSISSLLSYMNAICPNLK
jgi:hypothetical protein